MNLPKTGHSAGPQQTGSAAPPAIDSYLSDAAKRRVRQPVYRAGMICERFRKRHLSLPASLQRAERFVVKVP